jgi:superfamily II DNA or RNA helicase
MQQISVERATAGGVLIPRPYQREAVDAVKIHLDLHGSTILVAATGTGKTAMFALLCKEWPREWGRILILAHRRELVKQAWKMIRRVCPEDGVDMEMDTFRANHGGGLFGPASRIVVASKDTMLGRLRSYDPKQFGLVITDEAHHAVKKNSSYWTVLRHFKHAKQLGVTATPDRHDQEALGGIYKSVAYSYDILQAVTDAYLVPIQQQVVTVTGLDFSGVKEAKKGDLDPEDLDFIMKNEAIVQRIVNPTIDLANSGGKNRRVLFFATSVDQAKLMAEVINRRCPGKAIALSGEDEKDVRDGALDKYRAGDYQFLCGCEIFTEGFDEPTIQIVVPKPTQARSKYAQMIGRGTRTWPGVLDGPGLETVEARRHAIRHSPKPSLLVLDFCGVSGQHKLITAVDIMGGVFSPEVVAKAKERLAGKGEAGGRGELLTELRAARKELEEMEADRRRKIVAKAAFEMRPVDPFDLFDVVPKKEPRWLRGRKATLKQVQFLLRNSPEGTRLPDDLSLHDASVLIEDIKTKKEAGPPTEKMALTLQRFGYATDGLTYKDAKGILDELSAAGWRRIDKAAPSQGEGSHDDSD